MSTTSAKNRIKRTRRGSIIHTQSTPTTMGDAISMQSAPVSMVSSTGVHDQNGNERQSASSVLVKRKGRQYLSVADITSLICPPFKTMVTSYGFNSYLFDSSQAASTAGILRNIYQPAGGQYWFEAIGLPARNLDTNPTIFGVEDLYKKAIDIRNTANITNPGSFIDGAAGQYNQTFQYMSGFQIHEFVNAGNTTVHMEFWEVHPRHPMIGYYVDTNVKAKTIGADVLADYVTNQPLANALFPKYTTTSYDSVNDISVRIRPDLPVTNAKYKVSKPTRVTIQPGGTFVYTMRFEPFKFTNDEWNYLIGNNSNPSLNNATWMPGFTKVFVARMWGELSHSAAPENHLYGAVNCGPLNLLHIMKEYHHCRACPFQPIRNTIIDYRLDVSTTAVEHQDELEQTNEAFDD